MMEDAQARPGVLNAVRGYDEMAANAEALLN